MYYSGIQFRDEFSDFFVERRKGKSGCTIVGDFPYCINMPKWQVFGLGLG
jgi:hypothetical protein